MSGMLPFGIKRAVHIFRRFPCSAFLVQDIGVSFLACLPLAQDHQCRVSPDAREPSREFAGPAKGAQVSIGSKQGVLKRVFCIFMASNNREDSLFHHRRMSSTKFDERLVVTRLCRQ